MHPAWLTSPTWCHALTFAERIATLSGDHAAYPLSDADAERGRRRLQRWRSQPPFSQPAGPLPQRGPAGWGRGPTGVTDAYFAQRLALDGIQEERLLQVLGEPVENLQARLRELPAWLLELAEAFARPASGFASPPPGEEMLGFLDLIQPLVDRACDRLSSGLAALASKWPRLPFDPETVVDVLLMNLPEPLLTRLGRTLVLELNVARLKGLLDGATPEARFQSFIRRLRQPEEAIAILAEYPVLARQLSLCVDQWAEVSLEFLERLCSDWQAICGCLSPAGDPGPLVELVGGAGDTHRGGRSVMVARFASDFQLVYKPKSLAVDAHFQELLAWLNRRGCAPPLRTLTILDRGAYGWVEYVQHQGCTSVTELERFYRRLGAYLALLYILNATDFHLENLIAAGEQPVLIDLETLFHPRFDRFEGAEQAMANSVLLVGLLPQRMWGRDEYAGIDISGLGGAAGQLSPDRVPQPAGAGTDAMRYVRQRVELPGQANRPSLDGVEASALDHVQDLLAGFTAMFRLLIEQRAELLASDGPLARFAQDEIRALLRPTRTYDQLLFESFHPDMLHQGLERDLLLDRLWTVVPERPYMAGVIAAEQADLRRGDIPVFTTRPTSLDLRSAAGETIAGVLTDAGMALVQRRLGQLDDRDMRRQVWFIRASLATLESGSQRPARPAYRLVEPASGASRARLIAAARAVADHLAETAIHAAQDVTWIGLEPRPGQTWDITPLGMDLYGGIPGVALFLAYAGAVVGAERYTALARRALNAISRQVQVLRTELPEIGGFEGWGGLLYTLTHLGVLWDDPAVLSQAGDIVDVLAGFVDQDDEFGVVRGAAGAIGSLLAFQRCLASNPALKAASACGDHLIASAQSVPDLQVPLGEGDLPAGRGLGWVIPRLGPRPLAGFAHGAAGIAWALLELAAVTGDERYRVAARHAIDYERSLYSPAAQNWPDLRQADPDPPHFMAAWCHGAAGIGLARLRALPHLDDPKLGDEIHIALHTTLARGFGQTHSLCHGDMGNLDLLLEASRVLNDPEWRVQLDRLAAMILDSIDRHGWQCAGPEGVEMPGLMLGLAGIGYQMLRLAEPDRVPSVLVLAPPIQ
jgi:type 2 lantibiotic biosynthesis protein LanM